VQCFNTDPQPFRGLLLGNRVKDQLVRLHKVGISVRHNVCTFFRVDVKSGKLLIPQQS
jgi:hypothetical protein